MLPRGALIGLTGINPMIHPHIISRKHIKTTIEGLGFPVGYITYVYGEHDIIVRLKEKGAALELLSLLHPVDCKLQIDKCDFELALITGAEETKQLRLARARKSRRRARYGRFNPVPPRSKISHCKVPVYFGIGDDGGEAAEELEEKMAVEDNSGE